MVLEKQLLPFHEWLLFGPAGFGALFQFLFILAIGALLGVFLAYLFTAVRHGPIEAFYIVAQVMANAIPDFFKISPRRVWAMARLAVKESFRRRVFVAFIVFVVVLLYARWFLDVKSDHPARLYLSFVMTASTYLMMVLALFLSTFSLPNDIKNRTIYTVVTKPVRSSEIVLGRILGFTIVGTVLLAIMCALSYGFVRTGLNHVHQVELEGDVQDVLAQLDRGEVWTGQTSSDSFHRHTITLQRDGDRILGETDLQLGHRHDVRVAGTGSDAKLIVDAPYGDLQARVPVYGKLRFQGRSGNPRDTGINVGKEWSYRSYIEGGTLAAAIWTFEGVTPERFPNGLPLELTLSVFRTYKGDIERGVLGTIVVKNPDRNARIRSSTPRSFESQEFVTDEQLIPRRLQAIGADGSTVEEVDLFESLVDENGRVEVWLQCAERAQYFGVAQADVYLRAANRAFWWNFVKGFAGIWLQLLLVVCFGVMFSTFLSGPIAMLATLSTIVLGSYTRFIVDVFGGVVQGNPLLNRIFYGGIAEQSFYGGGPIESFIRMHNQKNVMVDLDLPWLTEIIIKWVDIVLMSVMYLVTVMLPDFSEFNTSRFVAYGYNINGHLLAQQFAVAAAFFLVVAIIGYFFLKTREIAA